MWGWQESKKYTVKTDRILKGCSFGLNVPEHCRAGGHTLTYSPSKPASQEAKRSYTRTRRTYTLSQAIYSTRSRATQPPSHPATHQPTHLVQGNSSLFDYSFSPIRSPLYGARDAVQRSLLFPQKYSKLNTGAHPKR